MKEASEAYDGLLIITMMKKKMLLFFSHSLTRFFFLQTLPLGACVRHIILE